MQRFGSSSSFHSALRVGCVSFLNTRPLIEGLDRCADVELHFEVPARLLGGMIERRFDVGLLPIIDYQRLDDLLIVPSGGIGSDGHTLTVRIFSRTPIGEIHTLACDTDSHTSVALARIILAERFACEPKLIDYRKGHEEDEDALLLIGDKVVCAPPQGFEHELDLGQAWKDLTGLPFVFAVWMTRAGTDLRDLPQRLVEAKERGMRQIDRIVAEHAVSRGWPGELARQYLTENLKFDVGERQMEAIGLFHEKAGKLAIIPTPVRPLTQYALRITDHL